jgi:chromosome segregation ATPase
MSDTNAFVNAYIDSSVGMIHEYISQLLNTKAQLRVANEILSTKDAAIATLNEELSSYRNNSTANTEQMVTLRESHRQMEEQYNAMVNKASHMETLLKQVSEMKNEILSRDETIRKLTEETSSIIAIKNALADSEATIHQLTEANTQLFAEIETLRKSLVIEEPVVEEKSVVNEVIINTSKGKKLSPTKVSSTPKKVETDDF